MTNYTLDYERNVAVLSYDFGINRPAHYAYLLPAHPEKAVKRLQHLEYLITAVNDGLVDYSFVHDFCGNEMPYHDFIWCEQTCAAVMRTNLDANITQSRSYDVGRFISETKILAGDKVRMIAGVFFDEAELITSALTRRRLLFTPLSVKADHDDPVMGMRIAPAAGPNRFLGMSTGLR